MLPLVELNPNTELEKLLLSIIISKLILAFVTDLVKLIIDESDKLILINNEDKILIFPISTTSRLTEIKEYFDEKEMDALTKQLITEIVPLLPLTKIKLPLLSPLTLTVKLLMPNSVLFKQKRKPFSETFEPKLSEVEL
jgi:hypothetical protein